jgi:hypothetical protein
MADVVYLLRSQVTGRPFLIERDDLAEMRQLVARLVQTQSFDVVHADQLTMTQFALQAQALAYENGVKRPFTIFDAHNATWTITRRMIRQCALAAQTDPAPGNRAHQAIRGPANGRTGPYNGSY